MTEPIALITCGPADHGLTRFGRELARAAQGRGFTGTVAHCERPDGLRELLRQLPGDVRRVHLQVNDWLYAGSGPAEHRIAEIADDLAGRAAELSVTLHDLPQRGAGPALYARRAASYSAMVASVAGVVVSSHHESNLLAEAILANGADVPDLSEKVLVIPLPVHRLAVDTPAGTDPSDAELDHEPATVGIFGFIYPGKGHQELIEELAGIETAITVVAIGRPSDGHEWMLDDLADRARRHGITLRCTGYLSDDDALHELRRVSVPVAPHPQVSASGSINSWIGSGRRPLVLDGRYTRELDARLPGAVRRYRLGRLREAVVEAIRSPSSTMLPPGFDTGPDAGEVAARHLAWLRADVAAPAPLSHRQAQL